MIGSLTDLRMIYDTKLTFLSRKLDVFVRTLFFVALVYAWAQSLLLVPGVAHGSLGMSLSRDPRMLPSALLVRRCSRSFWWLRAELFAGCVRPVRGAALWRGSRRAAFCSSRARLVCTVHVSPPLASVTRGQSLVQAGSFSRESQPRLTRRTE